LAVVLKVLSSNPSERIGHCDRFWYRQANAGINFETGHSFPVHRTQ